MKVSIKRQITLPVEQCSIAGIHAGDELQSYVNQYGEITIIKKCKGAAEGILKDVTANPDISENASLQSAISS